MAVQPLPTMASMKLPGAVGIVRMTWSNDLPNRAFSQLLSLLWLLLSYSYGFCCDWWPWRFCLNGSTKEQEIGCGFFSFGLVPGGNLKKSRWWGFEQLPFEATNRFWEISEGSAPVDMSKGLRFSRFDACEKFTCAKLTTANPWQFRKTFSAHSPFQDPYQ